MTLRHFVWVSVRVCVYMRACVCARVHVCAMCSWSQRFRKCIIRHYRKRCHYLKIKTRRNVWTCFKDQGWKRCSTIYIYIIIQMHDSNTVSTLGNIHVHCVLCTQNILCYNKHTCMYMYASVQYRQYCTLLCKEVDMLKDHQPSIMGSWLAGEIPTERSLVRQRCVYTVE